ncbi:HD domain-containing protein [Sinomicrobium pectinilyticum]|uniref:HD domain-containing protein n=1 Tax=Sinomicrobium pectinilyticum TaxID=1084421 RepID=A0A3N0DHQ8_SINP1|nr:HD domain-containing protein [Sinomicrobium pectinilyticum]RNL75232.1 HD domain-containing protein [Sinomicrobium pectinilyticum]
MKYVDKIYGEFEFSGVIEEIIKTNVFQRLKKIHQGGSIFLVNPKVNHTRFEHSIGVMLIIKKLGGSIEEQIAGLIHDISHTAFSHLIDYVLDIEGEDYHENRYGAVLKDSELNAVLEKYQMDRTVFMDIEKFKLLEYPLPYLSADRIDYTLRDMFQIGEISLENISWFINGLATFDHRIVLKSEDYGKWFQAKYNFLTAEYFEGEENVEINIIMKTIIKDCLEKGIIEEKDFFEDDFYLMDKINQKFNLMQWIVKIRGNGLKNKKLKTKKRIVNPEIIVHNQILKLSEVN